MDVRRGARLIAVLITFAGCVGGCGEASRSGHRVPGPSVIAFRRRAEAICSQARVQVIVALASVRSQRDAYFTVIDYERRSLARLARVPAPYDMRQQYRRMLTALGKRQAFGRRVVAVFGDRKRMAPFQVARFHQVQTATRLALGLGIRQCPYL